MIPSLRQLEAFQLIARLGGVGQAAAAMHISQPAVSHLIKTLQRDIGLTLFIKDGRGLRLTPEGEHFYTEAERLLLTHDEMTQQIERLRSGHKGRLNIACDPSWAGEVIGPPLRKFLQKFPQISVIVQPTDPSELIAMISASRYDVCFMSVTVGSSYFTEETIGQSPAVIVLPCGHPLCRQEVVRIEDIGAEKFLVLSSRRNATFYRSALIFDKLNIRRDNLMFIGVAELLFNMIESGAGVALMSRMVARSLAERYRVEVRPIAQDISYDIYAGYRLNGANALSHEFVRMLRSDLLT